MYKVNTKMIKDDVSFNDNNVQYDFMSFLGSENIDQSEMLKCILLSDAKLSKEDLTLLDELCFMQIIKQQRFRYIKSVTGKFHPGSRPLKANTAYNLLSRGSVLFIKNDMISEPETSKTMLRRHLIEQIFNKSKEFKQIGYNYILFTSAKTI